MEPEMNSEKIEYRPLDGQSGHLGGVESIVLDNVIYYFGFDYSSDLVISPLINDLDLMCEFAEKYMLQLDGSHDVEYWRELAGYDSELCVNESDRIFIKTDLILQLTKLAGSKQRNTQASNFNIEYHLCYLLNAAGEWSSGVDLDLMADQIAILNGEQPLENNQTYSEIASDLEASLSALIRSARGNWSEVFSLLDAHQD
jgi:hypothetical protein